MAAEERDFLFRDTIGEVDPCVAELIERETERQKRKLIMIPSESYAPKAVREALGSVFQNVYAEGYPRERTMRYPEELLADQSHCLVYYRRYANRRFYKGVDYVDIIESLAARRAAMCFSKPGLSDDDIFVNVQALSGSAANLAIYDALLEDGDTLMGLDLFQGGHLTHGSEFNQSGKRYKVISYGVEPSTEKLDYDRILALAKEHRPKLIIAGFTSYPWAPDFEKFREIADEVGAYLMADIAHSAGLVVGGVYPNPVGIADVTVFTTHKTLGGPRGAVILTTDEETALAIDNSVFPGAQGGPHINKMTSLALVFRLAQSDKYRALQERTVENARALAQAFTGEGLRVVYGGTDTHIVMVDVSGVGRNPEKVTPFTPGIPLRGEIAARVLDLTGVVVNKNTIPGDTMTVLAHGIRFGTPWVTQRGLGPSDMKDIAKVVRKVVTGIKPFAYRGVANELPRGKIDLDLFEEAKCDVASLVERAGFDLDIEHTEYPHYCYERGADRQVPWYLQVSGWRSEAFLQELCTINISSLAKDEIRQTYMLDENGDLIADAAVCRIEPDIFGRDRFVLRMDAQYRKLPAWLRGIADGYVIFDKDDVFRKVQGPVVVEELEESRAPSGLAELSRKSGGSPGDAWGPPAEAGTAGPELYKQDPEAFDLTVPYVVGFKQVIEGLEKEPQPQTAEEWSWSEPENKELKRTELFEAHKALGAKMVPFAGWEMPVWYTSVTEEHAAVREAAGLFDVSHMGCFEVRGKNAIEFLDTVTSNYVHWLQDGETCYTYLLDTSGEVIDDLIIYRISKERFLLVVNAANEDKDWDWLDSVLKKKVIIDKDRPWVAVPSRPELINLKSSSAGKGRLRDIALQGPASNKILKACAETEETRDAVDRLRRTMLTELELGGFSVIAARTGYTGEKMGYELFVHPDDSPAFWNMLLEKGESFGIKPCGLACRDSTRIEAGLPLYGHELAGDYDMTPAEAGFAGYVKYHKPFFIGRDVLLSKDMKRERELIRWRVEKRGVRRPNPGDPVVNKNGVVIGNVTSCSINADNRLLGLAVVQKKYTEPGSEIGIYVLQSKKKSEPSVEEAKPGDRLTVPVPAVIMPRFFGGGGDIGAPSGSE